MKTHLQLGGNMKLVLIAPWRR